MLKPDYSIVAKNYDDNKDRLSIPKEEAIGIKLLENRKIRILDLGCGTGNYIKMQDEYYNHNVNLEWYGLDLSLDMLDIAKKKVPFAKLINTSVEKMNFGGLVFDIIVCNFAFHQFENKCIALDNVDKGLSKDGVFIQRNIFPEMMKEWWVYRYCPNTYFEDLHRFWTKDLIVYELEKRKYRVNIEVKYLEDYRSYSNLKDDYLRRDVSQLSMIDDYSYNKGLEIIEKEIMCGNEEFKNVFSMICIKAIRRNIEQML